MKIHFELEENETWITPLKVAEALMNVGEEDELMEIAEYLQVYCKYNRPEVE